MADPKPRRARRSAEQTRTALLEVGRQILAERGLSMALAHVTLADAIERADVPRQSAYRLYQGKEVDPQQAFRVDVMRSLLEGDLTETGPVADPVLEFLDEGFGLLGAADPVEKAVLFREGLRLSCSMWTNAVATSPGFPVFVVSLIAVATDPNPPPHLADALEQSSIVPISIHRDVQTVVNEQFGIRYRAGVTPEAFGNILAAITMGLTVDEGFDPQSGVVLRNTGADGQPQEWTRLAIVTEALTVRLMEPDPAADTPMDFDVLSAADWVG